MSAEPEMPDDVRTYKMDLLQVIHDNTLHPVSSCCRAAARCEENLAMVAGELACVGTYFVYNKCGMACDADWVRPDNAQTPAEAVGARERIIPLSDQEWQGIQIALIRRMEALQARGPKHGHAGTTEDDQQVVDWLRVLFCKIHDGLQK